MKKTLRLTVIALMTALICVFSVITVPIAVSPVPVTLSLVAIGLSVYILKVKHAITALILYVLLGAVGIPVFAGFTSGPGQLIGPLGGYIIGYFPMVLISGYIIGKSQNYFLRLIGMITGILFCYLIGTLWLMFRTETDFIYAVSVGVLPFLIPDMIKAVAVTAIGPRISKQVKKYIYHG